MEHIRKRSRAVFQTNFLKGEMRLILVIPREARPASGRGENLWRGNNFVEETMLIATIALGGEYSKIDSAALKIEHQNLETGELRDYRDGGNPRKNDCNSGLDLRAGSILSAAGAREVGKDR